MVREIITLSIGGAGIRLGTSIWQQYHLEHYTDESLTEERFRSFYQENDGIHRPRNLMIDLETDAINELKTSQHAQMFDPDHMLYLQDGSGGTFARAHFDIGKLFVNKTINDKLRIIIENCDNVQGFICNHSIGGGTGSGLTSLLLERIAVDYRKKTRIGFNIYPFDNNHSNNYVAIYNAMLAIHWLLDHQDVRFMFDNRRLHRLCKDKLHIDHLSYYDMNSIVTKIASGITHSLRFDNGEIFEDLNEMQTNLVPWPRLADIISSMAPLINKHAVMENKKILVDGFVREYANTNLLQQRELLYQDIMNMIYSIYDITFTSPDLSLQDIATDVFKSEYFSIDCPDFDVEKDCYMSFRLRYDGDVDKKEAQRVFRWLRYHPKEEGERTYKFTDWLPSLNYEISDMVSPSLPDDKIADTNRRCVLMGNNVHPGNWLHERICKPYDKMYSQRAFVHWFVGYGMEEGEFAEAREDLGFLKNDYRDVLSEQTTDEASDDD